MEKSQLRILAREYAQGRLEADEYRTQRRMLLDGIVSGRIAIEREHPPPPPPPAPVAEAPAVAAVSEDVTGSPAPKIAIAAAVVVVLAMLVWIFMPSSEAPEPVPTPPSTVEEQLPPRQVSEARALVERFAANRDWGESSIAEFRRAWSSLPMKERSEAISAHWFRRLAGALRDEIKTQLALAEFDQTGAAGAKVKRLIELGEFLGVADRLPTAGPTAAPAPPATPVPTTTATATATETSPPSSPAPSPPTPPAPAPGAARALAAVAADDGKAWLAAQDADAHTLQLFAVNHIEKIERIVAEHPRLGLRILASAGGEPRYRVVWGTFPTTERAKAGYAQLPASIREIQPSPFVKSFAELRQDLARTGGAAPAADAAYTVQLFASDSRENAARLVSAYPGLALRVQETTDTRSPYRVVFGDFADEASARDAAAALPAELVSRAGTPLVKSLAELNAVAAPGR